jgi:hypothetical protein
MLQRRPARLCDGPVVVLDINGVLADVRKKAHPAIPAGLYAASDVFIIPNGQHVYLRPGIVEFLRSVIGLIRQKGGMVGIWTSRMQRNADPIVDWILSRVNADRNTAPLQFDFCLTGESCTSRPDPLGGPRPLLIKNVARLRTLLTYWVDRHAGVLFLDDNIDTLVLDSSSWFMQMRTYNAYTIVAQADCDTTARLPHQSIAENRKRFYECFAARLEQSTRDESEYLATKHAALAEWIQLGGLSGTKT